MVQPYITDGKLTYDEFEKVFDMLSLREQYSVLEILAQHNIELEVEKANNSQSYTDTADLEAVIDDFGILYDDDLFADEYEENATKENTEDKGRSESLLVRKKISMSNRTLIKLIQEGNEQAKQDLCIKNKKLVDKFVNGYIKISGNKLDFEDLEQVGMIGMLTAAEKFNFNMGTEFSTYATWWIKQAISREINDTGFTIRIPVHKMEQIFKVCKFDSLFMAETNPYTRMELISEATGYPVAVVEDCLILYSRFLRSASLDVPIGDDEDILLGDMIPNEAEETLEDKIFHIAMREELELVLATLTQREQKVIRLRFGFDDGRTRTLEEIGQEFNVTRERIRQIEAKVLRKLRHPSRSKRIKVYLD